MAMCQPFARKAGIVSPSTIATGQSATQVAHYSLFAWKVWIRPRSPSNQSLELSFLFECLLVTRASNAYSYS